MGKNSGCMTVSDRCISEIAELRDILADYNIDDSELERIENMIVEPYFELNTSFASGRAMERILDEMIGDESKEAERFRKYLVYLQEEKERYPFTVDLNSDEINDEINKERCM